MVTTRVIAAAAVSARGRRWRSVARDGAAHDLDGGPPPRARKMMTRGALLAALGLRDLAAALDRPLHDAGFFLGVGASAGPMEDVVPMLAASIGDDGFSLARFGRAGLAACNPLLAFQLMNNFTLCHAAIQEGVGGPSGAFFSRGGGTATALVEARAAIAAGDCAVAIAGGADSALHPVTWAELVRDGFAAGGLVAGEGCALVALAADGAPGLAVVESCALHHAGDGDTARLADVARGVVAAWATARDEAAAVVIAPWGEPPRRALRAAIEAAVGRAVVIDVSTTAGDALAASPALAWVAAVDRICAGLASRVLVLGAGVDGDLGVAAFAREAS